MTTDSPTAAPVPWARLLRPKRWTPPTAPARAAQRVSTPPMPPLRLLEMPARGPEDVLVDESGQLLTGLADGSVVRVDPATGTVTPIANTGGRPLGVEPLPDGGVLVCDSVRGLLQVHADGRVEVLVDEVDGERLTFASNVARAGDGTIYFSASTRRFDLDHYLGDIFEHSGTGRLFRRTPDGRVDTLLDGLQFANGVVLAPDGSRVFVAQSGDYSVVQYWLTGPKAGSSEPLIDNLPGFPDNMSLGSDGLVWISLASPRNPFLDRLAPLPGVLRQVTWLLPDSVRPAAVRTTWVMAVDLDGAVVHDLQADGSQYAFVTSVAERDGVLYLGSLHEPAIAVTRVP